MTEQGTNPSSCHPSWGPGRSIRRMRRITARTKLTFVSSSPLFASLAGLICRVYTKTHSTSRDNAKLKLSLVTQQVSIGPAIRIDKSSGLHATLRRIHLPPSESCRFTTSTRRESESPSGGERSPRTVRGRHQFCASFLSPSRSRG